MTRSEYLKAKKNARQIPELEAALAVALMRNNAAEIEAARKALEKAVNGGKAADFLA